MKLIPTSLELHASRTVPGGVRLSGQDLNTRESYSIDWLEPGVALGSKWRMLRTGQLVPYDYEPPVRVAPPSKAKPSKPKHVKIVPLRSIFR